MPPRVAFTLKVRTALFQAISLFEAMTMMPSAPPELSICPPDWLQARSCT